MEFYITLAHFLKHNYTVFRLSCKGYIHDFNNILKRIHITRAFYLSCEITKQGTI